MNWVSTPPCRMKSSSNRPTSLSANAVQTAVFKPKQRRNPRATLYSPPPSQALNSRAVRTRPSPGSSRSMISPSAIRSYRHEPAGLIFKSDMGSFSQAIGNGSKPYLLSGERPGAFCQYHRSEKERPLTPALSHRMGEGEDPLAAGSRAASHPNPLSIGWREGEEGLRGGWWYSQDARAFWENFPQHHSMARASGLRHIARPPMQSLMGENGEGQRFLG